MKTSTMLVLILLLALLGVGALVVGQAPETPPAESAAQQESDDEALEEFVPTERVSFDSAISLPVDI